MPGTKVGGQKARDTNRLRYGLDYYAHLGRKGGLKSRGGGFAGNKALARIAGRLGGLKSRRRSHDR